MIIGSRLNAIVVRAAPPYWAHTPTSGDGASRYGGRFNPIGTPALYASFSFNAAAKEVRFALNADPFTFYFLEVDCEDIVDLTDSAVRRRLRISLADIEAPDWESEMRKGVVPSSHRAAASLIKRGAAGVIAPSFAKGATSEDRNLVLWTWVDVTGTRKRDPHSVRVLERDQLPVSGASWPTRS